MRQIHEEKALEWLIPLVAQRGGLSCCVSGLWHRVSFPVEPRAGRPWLRCGLEDSYWTLGHWNCSEGNSLDQRIATCEWPLPLKLLS